MSDKIRVGELLWGKVLEILPNGAMVALDEETQGFLHMAEIAEDPVNRVEGALQEGQEVLVKVIGYDRSGRPSLSLRRVTSQDREAAEFHREALEFRSLLSGQAVAQVQQGDRPEERLEWRLERWLAEAEASLASLRKRRSERLSWRFQGE